MIGPRFRPRREPGSRCRNEDSVGVKGYSFSHIDFLQPITNEKRRRARERFLKKPMK